MACTLLIELTDLLEEARPLTVSEFTLRRLVVERLSRVVKELATY